MFMLPRQAPTISTLISLPLFSRKNRFNEIVLREGVVLMEFHDIVN